MWDAVREQYRAELSRSTGPEVVRRRERKPERVEQLSYRPPINTTYSLEVHVIACERSLDVLFADLSAARCLRNKYQRLFIHVDACGVDSVLEQAKAYQWPCGDTTVRAAEQRRGLREMWFSVWDFMHERYLAHGDAAALVLEDDMTVSPAYAEWLQSAFDRIRESTYVLGASLSPIRVIEVSKPFARWNGNREVAGRTYLAAMPSSWGGAYWNSMAGPFMRYARARMKYHNYEAEAASSSDFSGGNDPYAQLELQPKEIEIPGLRSNVWPYSWKKHLIEFMYANGFVMAYPNLPQEAGYATSRCLEGVHTGSSATNPRIAPLVESLTLDDDDPDMRHIKERPAVRFGLAVNEWPVLDMAMAPTSLRLLSRMGQSFLNKVPHWGKHDYSDLLERWAVPQCILDRWLSAPTRPGERPKHLLYQPQYGVDNQMVAFTHASVLAASLGRTLIAPPLQFPSACATTGPGASRCNLTLPLCPCPYPYP